MTIMKKILMALSLVLMTSVLFAQDCEYCFGGTTDITVNEGTSWVWNTGATTQTITVTAGTYTVTITDDGGCMGEGSFTVTECPELTVICSGTDNIDCTIPNGEVTVAPTGGCDGSYTYVWTTGGSPIGSSQTISGLSAGTYVVLVTDLTGCSATCEVTIIDDPQISPVTFECDPNN